MTEFEFVFILYAFILGLSLVALLSGFGTMMERVFATQDTDERFRVGLLTPLLATFVLLDLMSFWLFAWVVQEQIKFAADTVLAVLAFSSAYYLAARLVFPSDAAQFEDMDTHFYRVRRLVLGILLVLFGAQWLFILSYPDVYPVNRMGVIRAVVFGALILLAMIPRRRALALTGLVGLNIYYFYAYLW